MAWSILVVLLQSVDDNDQIIFTFPEVNVTIDCYRVECAFRKMYILLYIPRQELAFLKFKRKTNL